MDQLEVLLKENTKAMVINHMSNATGQIVDFKRVGEFCRVHNILLTADVAQTHGPIISLNLAGWTSEDLADALYEDYDVCVRSGAHCTPLLHEHFKTVEQGMVRFSFSSFATKEEVKAALVR